MGIDISKPLSISRRVSDYTVQVAAAGPLTSMVRRRGVAFKSTQQRFRKIRTALLFRGGALRRSIVEGGDAAAAAAAAADCVDVSFTGVGVPPIALSAALGSPVLPGTVQSSGSGRRATAGAGLQYKARTSSEDPSAVVDAFVEGEGLSGRSAWRRPTLEPLQGALPSALGTGKGRVKPHGQASRAKNQHVAPVSNAAHLPFSTDEDADWRAEDLFGSSASGGESPPPSTDSGNGPVLFGRLDSLDVSATGAFPADAPQPSL